MIKFEDLYKKQFLEEDDSSANLVQDLASFKSAIGMGGQRGDIINKNLGLHKICDCGHIIKKSRGRYPNVCINCGLSLKGKKEIEEDINKKDDEETYEEFFKKTLKKFGVSEPNKLSVEKKKEFYNFIDKNWDAGKNETD
jgi:hypothetical protein